MSRPLRVGLAGTGYWARRTHAAGLRTHPGVNFTGLWGHSDATELAAELGVAAYASFDELLDDVEAVAFAVPPDVQAHLAVRAALRCRHLLLDKPVALDVPSAQRLAAAVDSAGVHAAVFFTLLYESPVTTWLADHIDAEWVAARIRLHSSIFEPGSPYAGSGWRRQHGALWDVGPHAVAMALRAMGPVESVVARRGVGDGHDVVVRHESGATTTMSLSLTAPIAAAGNDWTFYGRAGVEHLPVAETDRLGAYHAYVDDLVDAVRGAGSTRCDVGFGSAVVTALAAAQRSAAS